MMSNVKVTADKMHFSLKRRRMRRSRSGEDDSRVVRNVFDVLSQSQKTQSSSKVPHRHKSVPCKTCANCVRDNCGRCSSCRDMPQFGGRGLCRQSCVLRKCLKPTKGKCASCWLLSLSFCNIEIKNECIAVENPLHCFYIQISIVFISPNLI